VEFRGIGEGVRERRLVHLFRLVRPWVLCRHCILSLHLCRIRLMLVRSVIRAVMVGRGPGTRDLSCLPIFLHLRLCSLVMRLTRYIVGRQKLWVQQSASKCLMRRLLSSVKVSASVNWSKRYCHTFFSPLPMSSKLFRIFADPKDRHL